MILELTIPDRFSIKGVLPPDGGRVEMNIARNIEKKVEFSSEELSKNKVVDMPNGGVHVPPDSLKITYKIEFTIEEIAKIKEYFNKLDSENKIPRQMIDTCEKFLAIN